IDFRLSQIRGVRLDWDVISLAMGPKVMWRMAAPYLPGALAALGIMALVYALGLRMAQLCARRSRTLRGANPPGRGVWYAVASFVLLGALGLVAAKPDKAEGQAGMRLAQTSPFWKRVATRTVSREKFLRSAQALGLGDFEAAGRTYSASGHR